jgi:hypothetical protein
MFEMKTSFGVSRALTAPILNSRAAWSASLSSCERLNQFAARERGFDFGGEQTLCRRF